MDTDQSSSRHPFTCFISIFEPGYQHDLNLGLMDQWSNALPLEPHPLHLEMESNFRSEVEPAADDDDSDADDDDVPGKLSDSEAENFR